ncbi:hypothetical protein [Halobacterium hubeiense]|uniref:hypothetical protein n=1 Tax=Halobacterium hubeiense TaxID=1407499 RepID=UPI003C726D46
MASKDDRKWFRVDDDLSKWLSNYAEREPEYDNESEAIRGIIEEHRDRDRSPVDTLRPHIIDAAVHLVLVAAVVAICGAGTDIIADLYALQIGGVLVVVAGGVLGAFELAHRLTTNYTPAVLSGENA